MDLLEDHFQKVDTELGLFTRRHTDSQFTGTVDAVLPIQSFKILSFDYTIKWLKMDVEIRSGICFLLRELIKSIFH